MQWLTIAKVPFLLNVTETKAGSFPVSHDIAGTTISWVPSGCVRSENVCVCALKTILGLSAWKMYSVAFGGSVCDKSYGPAPAETSCLKKIINLC